MFYYGNQCDRYCKARDDERGHYRCNPVTGEKICLFGWGSDDCLTNLDDCNGHRCHDGATCMDHIGYYTCKCPPGRTGVYCDGEINECASSPCHNGGTCVDESNGFTCECPEGWAGLLCEIKIVPCKVDNCVHVS
ncbi:protein jagged-1b-like [Aplysia californica]|uniref:Delta-like protein n=1 Tax=Aplysia californica TaxID=6500 RepID=A0ABM1VWW7_APLCA|nr:protein jagged-1b-like [Aplysia californica]